MTAKSVSFSTYSRTRASSSRRGVPGEGEMVDECPGMRSIALEELGSPLLSALDPTARTAGGADSSGVAV